MVSLEGEGGDTEERRVSLEGEGRDTEERRYSLEGERIDNCLIMDLISRNG